jgi:hypothetical protein
MDSDKIEGEFKQESGDPLPDNSNVFQSLGIRRFVRSCDEVDRVLLGYGYNFLLPVGIFLWALLLISS